jgi:hypothetical protein
VRRTVNAFGQRAQLGEERYAEPSAIAGRTPPRRFPAPLISFDHRFQSFSKLKLVHVSRSLRLSRSSEIFRNSNPMSASGKGVFASLCVPVDRITWPKTRPSNTDGNVSKAATVCGVGTIVFHDGRHLVSDLVAIDAAKYLKNSVYR